MSLYETLFAQCDVATSQVNPAAVYRVLLAITAGVFFMMPSVPYDKYRRTVGTRVSSGRHSGGLFPQR